MKKVLLVLIGASVLSCVASAATPNCNDITGDWVNELDSILTISNVGDNGMLMGTYSSPSGTSGDDFSLVGWTNEAPIDPEKSNNVRVVSFSVNWDDYGSVTSWSGSCSMKDGIPTISTIWNLVRSNSDFDWDHIYTNSDTFTPM